MQLRKTVPLRITIYEDADPIQNIIVLLLCPIHTADGHKALLRCAIIHSVCSSFYMYHSQVAARYALIQLLSAASLRLTISCLVVYKFGELRSSNWYGVYEARVCMH